MRIIIIFLAVFSLALDAMEFTPRVTYSKDTSKREHRQSLGARNDLRRGSLAIDIKTLIKTIPRIVKKKENQIPTEWIEHEAPDPHPKECSLTWIGHATFLLQSGTLCALIDPFWGDYTLGPLTLYKRLLPAALTKDEVPTINVIALTHNHVDHCDKDALQFFCKRDNPIALVPEGDQDFFTHLGFTSIVPCQWGDSVSLHSEHNTLECHFLPAAHDSDRNAWW